MHAVGDVSISDVDLGVASKAIILGFNVGITGSVKKYAECKSVEVRIYKIIYELIDDIRNAMEGLLEPVEVNLVNYLQYCFENSNTLLGNLLNYMCCRNKYQ